MVALIKGLFVCLFFPFSFFFFSLFFFFFFPFFFNKVLVGRGDYCFHPTKIGLVCFDLCVAWKILKSNLRLQIFYYVFIVDGLFWLRHYSTPTILFSIAWKWTDECDCAEIQWQVTWSCCVAELLKTGVGICIFQKTQSPLTFYLCNKLWICKSPFTTMAALKRFIGYQSN